MKRYVRPSLWLGFLLFGWGALTVGFTGIQTYGQIVGLRFLIGVFEVRCELPRLCQTFRHIAVLLIDKLLTVGRLASFLVAYISFQCGIQSKSAHCASLW